MQQFHALHDTLRLAIGMIGFGFSFWNAVLENSTSVSSGGGGGSTPNLTAYDLAVFNNIFTL